MSSRLTLTWFDLDEMSLVRCSKVHTSGNVMNIIPLIITEAGMANDLQ